MSNSQTPEPGTERTLRSSVRNPRRRQRQSDGDSLRTTAPRRKRSKLSEDTFVARGTIETPELDEVESVTGMNGHARGSTGRGGRKESTPMVDLPVRGGKKPATVKHRALKGDGATLLTQNTVYSAKLLPSTPRELRREGVEYRGSLGAGHHALAVTRTHAYVWDYTAHTTVSNARLFDIPFPAREGEALPFGALVMSGTSTDIGLLLVSATMGKVVFHESIERALSLGMFQERKTGVEGTISGFSSSETVTDMTSADHAGFILTLSSGRIIQITLRDAQGKPRIFTQALRPGDGGSSGFFGSFKGLWSEAWKKGVTAVRTRALDQRGQMQAIALTERCEVQIWDLDWSGRYEFRSNVDFREVMVQEMESLAPVKMGQTDSIAALDFVIMDKPASARGNELATLGAEQPVSMWLLLSMGSVDSPKYALAELSLAGDMVSIERTMKLESYHNHLSTQKPKLLIPKPGHTAVVAFEDALVLVATTDAESSDDPNAQLHEASYVDPQPFEDAVYLRSVKDLAIFGACAEDTKGNHSSSIAFVKGAGLMRLSATDPSGDVERSRIPAKSMIEQAVFYGAMQDNILDFSRKGECPYSTEEVEEATLAISNEILRSDTAFVSTNPTSIDAHLEHRARALRALVTHVRQNFPALSRGAMWQLLWDAEKVAAAQQMWKAFEAHKEAVSKVKRTATVLDELCAQLDNQHGLAALDETREDDMVRRFFVRGLERIGWVLSQMRELLEQLERNQTDPPEKVVRLVAEADDLWAKALEAAFNFRAENAVAYGMAPESVEDGVLSDPAEYTGLPGFWTSSLTMLKASQHIAIRSREFAKTYYEQADATSEVEAHIKQITVSNPPLIQLCCLIYKERIAWLSSRPSQHDRAEAQRLQDNFEAERHDQFRALASIGLANEGMQLAERYRDMPTLTELIIMETQYYVAELANPALHAEQRDVCAGLLAEMTGRISKYFAKFGDEWANAFFDEAFSGSRAGAMLDEAQHHWQAALTRHLRAEPARAKICWINDVGAEGDFAHAGKVLVEAAVGQETRLWARKVELSLGRLALMAAAEGEAAAAPAEAAGAGEPGRQLRVVELQERLYRHLHSEVWRAIDQYAEVELAMQKFGSRSAGYGALRQLLETEMERVLRHDALSVEELVDALTLMDSNVYASEAEKPDGNLEGAEFALALQALEAAAPGMPPKRFETALKVIWKRCFVHDDWVAITTAQAKKGGTTDSSIRSALRRTASWRTFYTLHSGQPSLLTQDSAAIRVLQPSDCLGAACMPQDLAYRFPEAELLDPILHDQKIMDEVLAGYVADRKLDEWVRDCEADAKMCVEEDVERAAEVRTKERELEEKWEKGGYINGVNGVNGVRDVEMG